MRYSLCGRAGFLSFDSPRALDTGTQHAIVRKLDKVLAELNEIVEPIADQKCRSTEERPEPREWR